MQITTNEPGDMEVTTGTDIKTAISAGSADDVQAQTGASFRLKASIADLIKYQGKNSIEGEIRPVVFQSGLVLAGNQSELSVA